MTVNLNISGELESKLRQFAEKKGLALDRYIQSILEENLKIVNKSTSPAEREVELIYLINQQSLSQDDWSRYNDLKIKRKNEEISSDELVKIQYFAEKLENLSAIRLKYLIELSELKNSTLEEVMSSLGIQAPGYA